ncbi:Hypothetical protein P9215_14731 [Prochlorococcus marinus str. MIT 9215]|uniref:Surface carbohydrate biosynthesis protein n=1 Tax=Prochlorococcus marinus (strain MIT 9215) TaxID=93060 RepID=A8G655_PROM2|nr:surface carbohydrate biosynthesis protein [Prochlorococcus marinus]ABV51086.1 Hypothetical protein P9215_14731 [Prochlorococcus marinus str. MIT 9215]
MKEWIYLPIETKNRELHSRILLALNAVLENFNVVIASKNKLRKLIRYYPPGFVFFKDHASNKTKEFMEEAISYSHKIILLDEESIVFHPDDIFKKIRVNIEATKLIDHAFFIGKEHKNVYERINVLKFLKDFTISGNPRFDMTTPLLRDTYKNEVLKLRKKYGKFILVNTHFAQANHLDGDRGFLARVKKSDYANDLEVRKYLEDLSNERKKLFENYCKDLIPNLSKEFKDFKIIIRTHPEENDSKYELLARKFKNIIVIHKGSVHPWILASELLIHSGCTTGTEAYALDKISIFYNCLKLNYPGLSTYEVENKTQLFSLIKTIIKGNTKKVNNDLKKLQKIINLSEDLLSFDSIIQALKKYKFKRKGIEINLSFQKELINNLLESVVYFFRNIKFLFYRKGMVKSGRKKFNGLNKKESIIIINALKKQLSIRKSIQIYNLGPDAILVKNK